MEEPEPVSSSFFDLQVLHQLLDFQGQVDSPHHCRMVYNFHKILLYFQLHIPLYLKKEEKLIFSSKKYFEIMKR